MKEDNVASQQQDQRQSQAAAAERIPAKNAARRRFAKTGVGVTGVILTLASKPGMATTTCTTGSAFANPSASNAPSAMCAGRSPGFWKNWPQEWAGAYTKPDAKFSEVFLSASTSAALANMSLVDVLDPPKPQDTNPGNGKDKDGKDKDKGGKGGSTPPIVVVKDPDPDNVARHIIAALLNARSRRVAQPQEQEIMEIWTQYAASGTYSPRKDVVWNGVDIVIFLKATMI